MPQELYVMELGKFLIRCLKGSFPSSSIGNWWVRLVPKTFLKNRRLLPIWRDKSGSRNPIYRACKLNSILKKNDHPFLGLRLKIFNKSEIVGGNLHQETRTSSKHLQLLSFFRSGFFVCLLFSLRHCGWLTLEKDPFFPYFRSSLLPGASIPNFCAPCWFGPCRCHAKGFWGKDWLLSLWIRGDCCSRWELKSISNWVWQATFAFFRQSFYIIRIN